MRKGFSKFNFNVFAIFVLLLALMLPVFAQDNVISSVTISKSKDEIGAYELNVDSSKMVSYRINKDDKRNIYFDLKDSILSDEIGIIYDDVMDIDNVVVRQVGNDKVRIYVKGKNVENTDLIFTNAIFENNKTSKKVIINKPITSYRSTTAMDDLENQEIQAWDDNSFNISHLLSGVFADLKDGPLGIVAIFVLVFAILAIIIKQIANTLSKDSEPLIGLNNTKYQPAKNIQQNIKQPQIKQPQINSRRNEVLENAKEQLAVAHQKYQTYLQNKYKDDYTTKIKSVNVDALKKGIALNQYQKSTKNPYMDQEVIRLNKEPNRQTEQGSIALQNMVQKRAVQTLPKKAPVSEFKSPYIQKPFNAKTTSSTAVQKTKNMKFLESVTKIYEQSGRGDLANGLKSSMTKAKRSI